MNWLNSTLGKVLICANSGTWGNPPAGNGSDYPILRSTNITAGRLSFEDIEFRSVSHEVAKKYILQSGDIIVTTSSGSSHLIGKNALFINPEDGQTYLFSNFTYCLRPNKKLIIPKFLYYYLNSNTAKAELLRIQSTTSGLRNLNTRLYLTQKISVPSISEQNRIVEILDRADTLRKKRSEADAKAERILPALFYKMFGDPATNPKGWQHTSIKSIVSKIERKDTPESPNTAFKYIDIAGVDGTVGRITQVKTLLGIDAPSRARQVVKMNDVIVSTVRPYLRGTALVPADLDNQICSTGFCVLRAKDSIGYGYLYALSRLGWFTQRLNERARGASYPAVTDNDILDLQVPYPTDKSVLKKCDKIVSQLNLLQEKRFLLMNKINNLFALLLAQAFFGSLTAKWREVHMKELLAEMEEQTKYLSNEVAT